MITNPANAGFFSDKKSNKEELMSDIKIGSVWQGKNNEGDVLIVWANKNQVHYDYLNSLRKPMGDVYDTSIAHFLEYFELKTETIDELCDRKNQELKDDMSTIYDQTEPKSQEVECDTPKAVQILNEAVAIMAERGKSYDKSGGEAERSMPKIVAMFNTLTGHTLTTEQGWDFMILLKLVRSSQGYKHDNYIDGSAYFGLAGEAASEAAND